MISKKKKHQTKRERIEHLETQAKEALSGQAHVYHFASIELGRLGTDRLMGSGIVLTMTYLGGKEAFAPTMIRNGLSEETIAALRADLVRSYEDAIVFKP